MIALIVVPVLIVADLCTGRRDSMAGFRASCVGLGILQAVFPLFLYFGLSGRMWASGREEWMLLAAWTAAVVYLCLRVMLSRCAYLPVSGRGFSLSGLGLRLNTAVLLGFLVAFAGMIAVVVSQAEMLLTTLGAVLVLVVAGLVCCLTIILFPIGLLLLYMAFAALLLEMLPSALVLVLGLLASAAILAASIVLGVKATLAAAGAGELGKREKVVLLVFMSLPLANTVPLLVLRRLLAKRGAQRLLEEAAKS